MKNSFKKSMMFMMLLLALTFSALGVTPALADDGVTPPTDAPVVEEPVADVPVVEEPAVDAPAADAPIVEQPVVAEEPAATEETVAASEEEIATVAEVLEQLPEETALVVLDADGETLPLVSEEAAQTLSSSSSDPFFWDGTQYVGFTTSTGTCTTAVTIAVCNQSVTGRPLQDAITAFGASSGATGNIYVAAGTYTASVTIDGSGAGNLINLAGLIGEGSGTTILNGNVTVRNMNAFTFQGFTLNGMFNANNNNGTLNITDVVQSKGGKTGINVESITGNVNLTDVSASGNGGYGVYMGNINGNVTVAGSGDFGNNGGSGFTFYNVTGDVTINDAVIHDNGKYGIYNNTWPAPAAITLNCVTFNNNTTDIVGPATENATPCGSNGQAYVPFGKAVAPPSEPVVSLSKVLGDKETSIFNYASFYTIFEQTKGQLPAKLEAGTFVSALKVALTNEGKDVTDLAMILSFPIPADMKDASLVVMFWNGSAWVEVSGGSMVNGFFVITVAQPGDYVLVAK